MDQWVPLSECVPLSKNVSVRVVVVEVEETSTSRFGVPFRLFLVADASGSISMAVFGVAARELRPGDVCEVRGANTGMRNGRNKIFLPEGKAVSAALSETAAARQDHSHSQNNNNNNNSPYECATFSGCLSVSGRATAT